MAKEVIPLTWEKPKILAMGLRYRDIELWLKIRGFRTDTPRSTIHRWLGTWKEIGYVIPFKNSDIENTQYIWVHVSSAKAKQANSLAYEKGYNQIYDSAMGSVDYALFEKTIDLAHAGVSE